MARQRLGTNQTSSRSTSSSSPSSPSSSSSGSGGDGEDPRPTSYDVSPLLSSFGADGPMTTDIHHRHPPHHNGNRMHRPRSGAAAAAASSSCVVVAATTDGNDDDQMAPPVGPSDVSLGPTKRRPVRGPFRRGFCGGGFCVATAAVAATAAATVTFFCRRNVGVVPPRRPFRVLLAVWVAAWIVVPLAVGRAIFAVRYLTMGRPALLYGSPTDWDDVRGCLTPSHRTDVRAYHDAVGRAAGGSAALWDRRRSLRSDGDGGGGNGSPVGADVGTTGVGGDRHHPLPLNPDVVWKWYRYSNRTRDDHDAGYSRNEEEEKKGADHDATAGTTSPRPHRPPPRPRRRLLVAQYSGFGSYLQILQSVGPVNRAYCRKWGHDYVTLEGTALQFPGMRRADGEDEDEAPCRNSNFEPQSTFNKIPLLFRALEEAHKYDQVLILDTDTMIVDLDFDITGLALSRSGTDASVWDDGNAAGDGSSSSSSSDSAGYFLVAYRVWRDDWSHTWDVNAGISLWNLHHPSTRRVAEMWLHGSLTHPADVLLKNDDQFFLQRSLISLGWWRRWSGVMTVRDEFEYYDATVVKHFKRDARSWSRTSLEQRLLRIQEAKAEVCRKWPGDCQEEEGPVGGGDHPVDMTPP